MPARPRMPLPYGGDLRSAEDHGDREAVRLIQRAKVVTGRQDAPPRQGKPAGVPAQAQKTAGVVFKEGEKVEYLRAIGTERRWVPAQVTGIDRSVLPFGVFIKLEGQTGEGEKSTDVERLRYPLASASAALMTPPSKGAWTGGPPGAAGSAELQGLMQGAAWIHKIDPAGRQTIVDTIARALS